MQQLINVYPFNLAMAIFGNEGDARRVYVPGIYAAIETLTEREADILRKRYYNEMTLRGIGQLYGVCQERIRQIEAKALRKLRHPAKSNMFRSVLPEEIKELKIMHQNLSREYELLAKAFEALSAKPAELKVIASMADLAVTRQTLIEDLNLSVRSYNCLRRAGIKTLGNIADMTMDNLMCVRNLGRKSANEVVAVVKSYGISIRESDK